MVRNYQERHSKKVVLPMFESLPEKQEEWKWMKDDMVVCSKIYEATDENDLDFAVAVFSCRNTY